MPQPWEAELGHLIQDQGWAGLLVLAADGREPDSCRWTRGRHLGLNLVWVDISGNSRLVYFTDMERDEATATGVECLGPADLGLTELRRETKSTGELIARTAMRLWRELELVSGPVGLGGRLAVGDSVDVIRALTTRDWQPVSGGKLLRQWRRRKLDFEVVDARRAARATTEAFLRLADRLRRAEREPVSVADLRRTVARHFAQHGLDQPHGNIVATGPAAAVPHSAGDDEALVEPGQTLVVDLYPRSLVYADCSRTFCLPPIPQPVADAHAAVHGALEAGCRGAVAGAKVSVAVDAALSVIEDAGFQTTRIDALTQRGMVHSLGHGVGYELHELPNLRPPSSGEFAAGDLITVEPGLYDPQAGWGIRLEDVLLLDEHGNENLTPLPYDLNPAAWPR